jgi:hypothetical protein
LCFWPQCQLSNCIWKSLNQRYGSHTTLLRHARDIRGSGAVRRCVFGCTSLAFRSNTFVRCIALLSQMFRMESWKIQMYRIHVFPAHAAKTQGMDSNNTCRTDNRPSHDWHS